MKVTSLTVVVIQYVGHARTEIIEILRKHHPGIRPLRREMFDYIIIIVIKPGGFNKGRFAPLEHPCSKTFASATITTAAIYRTRKYYSQFKAATREPELKESA